MGKPVVISVPEIGAVTMSIGGVPKIRADIESVVIQVGGDGPAFDGPYEVTPRAHNEVLLETKNLRMTDDVTVRKIPYYEVGNLTGETVYIGGEV